MQHLGITGTRYGTNSKQHDRLILAMYKFYEPGITLHHGDCKGVDSEAHEIAKRLGYKIEIHPPTNPSWRAFNRGDILHIPRGYKERDRIIVEMSEHLLVVPLKEEIEQPNTGTWKTYRMAKKSIVPYTILGR